MRGAKNGDRRVDAAIAGVGLCVGLLLAWPFATARGAGASTPWAGGPAESVAEVQRIARQVTVRLSGEGCLGATMGTGVRVGPGEVLTASHVVAGEASTTVLAADGERAGGTDISKLGAVDAASLHTTSDGPWVERRAGRPGRGETVVVAGSPGGGDVVVRSATVSGELPGRAPGDPPTSLLLDVEAQPGDSGGPVLDLEGRLVGIVYARANSDGRAMVIPVEAIPLGSGTAGVSC